MPQAAPFCSTDDETRTVLTSFSILGNIICCSSLLSVHNHLQAALSLTFDPKILVFFPISDNQWLFIGETGRKQTSWLSLHLHSALAAVIQRLQRRISTGVQSPS